MSRFIDLVGQKFGKLTVLGLDKSKERRTHWLCSCDCGGESIVAGCNMKNGHTKSCGCMQSGAYNLEKRKFGRWTVLGQRDHRGNYNQVRWDCQCECGTIRDVAGQSLLSGRSRSCGCLQNEMITEIGKKTGSESGYWKGGTSPIAKQIRGRLNFKQWRTNIFERDNYTCQKCKDRAGNGHRVTLNSHHITNFSSMYDADDGILFDINNGITLCEKCHKSFHKTHSTKDNTKEQINSFFKI